MKQATLVVVLVALLHPRFTFAHGESGSARIGNNFAVVSADEHEGIELSPNAISTAQIKAVPAQGLSQIPSSAVVRSLDRQFVYVLRERRFIRLDVTGKNLNSTAALDLSTGDQIVVSGAAILRSTELEVFSGEESEEHEEGESHEH